MPIPARTAAEADATAAREVLLEGRVGTDTLAEAIGVTERALYGYCQRGLPYIRIGNHRYFNLKEVRDWLAERSKPAPLPPSRGRGRPRTQQQPIGPLHVTRTRTCPRPSAE